MATSILKLYSGTNITPDRNCIVDGIQNNYLDKLTPTLSILDFQYVPMDSVTKTIRVPINQGKLVSDINYCSIYQYNTYYADNKYYYFFVTDVRWCSESVMEFTLLMDTLNTFNGEYTMSNKTNVIRQHTQRFPTTQKHSVDGFNLSPEKIDNVDEGTTVPLFKTDDSKIQESGTKQNQLWYLVYKTRTSDSNSPLDVYLLPTNNDVPYGDEYSSTVTWTVDDMDEDIYYFFPDRNRAFFNDGHSYINYANVEITTNGEIHFVEQATTYSSITFTSPEYYFLAQEGDNFYEVLEGFRYEIKAGASGTAYLDNIDTIDRSNPSIVKIIQLPYLPSEISWSDNDILLSDTGWEMKDSKIHLINYNSEFERNITTNKTILEMIHPIVGNTSDIIKTKPWNFKDTNGKYIEPKMYNSTLFNYKLNYDTFNSQIDLEKLKRTDLTHCRYDIDFKPTNCVSSELAFKWKLKDSATYTSDIDYPEVLISSRNNELGLVNSEYLNYLRVGFQADNDAKIRANTKNYIGVVASGLGIIGGSLASSTGFGAVLALTATASAITTLSNAIINSIEQDKSLVQKIEELKQQGANVTQGNAVDIFDWYNGNKLHIMKYQPTEETQKLFLKLFHLCGYARNKQETINTNNRLWFNYVQCEPVFESNQEIPNDFLDDIKGRYTMGVTIYHYNTIDGVGKYDWNQEYQNWETSIFN